MKIPPEGESQPKSRDQTDMPNAMQSCPTVERETMLHGLNDTLLHERHSFKIKIEPWLMDIRQAEQLHWSIVERGILCAEDFRVERNG